MINLAKPALDVGLYTNQLDSMLAFWQTQAGLKFSELLPVGGGVRQHRHAIGDSVLKINHKREPLPNTNPTGLCSLVIYSDAVATPTVLRDPDDNEVSLVPKGGGELNLSLNLTVRDSAAQEHFYASILGLPRSTHGDDKLAFLVGASEIILTPGRLEPFPREGMGYRYMTLQVFDVVGSHAQILAAGGTQGMPPTRLGDVAYISFVCDADGNWIEISQRKSITGSLQ